MRLAIPSMWVAGLLIGCPSAPDAPSTTGEGEPDDGYGSTAATADCQAVLDFAPSDGASSVYYRTAIFFTLDGVEGTEQISVRGPGGEVLGTSEIDGDVVSFTPAAPLSPHTPYDVTLDWCRGPTHTTWTTSEVGAAVSADDLLDRTYALYLGVGRFVTPAGLGPLVQQQLEAPLLLGVTAVTDTEITVLGALSGTVDIQDLCVPTFGFSVADFSGNPHFEIGPTAVQLGVVGTDIEIDDAVLSGDFAPKGSFIDGATLAGQLDTRALVPLLGGGSPNAACEAILAFGVACEPCVDGTGDFCVDLYVDSMEAYELAGVTLIPRSQADIDSDPSCN